MIPSMSPTAPLKLIVTIEGDAFGVVAAIAVAFDPPAIHAWMSGPVTEFLVTRTTNRFATEGDDASGKWAPLAPATETIRATMGYGPAHPINVRTGQLRDWVLDASPEIIVSSGGASMRYPSDPPSGKLAAKVETAQHGGGSTGKAPPRPVMAISEFDAVGITELLHKHIASAYVLGRSMNPSKSRSAGLRGIFGG